MGKTLELRPLAYIVLGYLAAAVVAVLLVWLQLSFGSVEIFLRAPGVSVANLAPNALASLPAMLLFGAPVCLVLELVLVTPVLVGFARYRWRWLNGWTGAAVGFVVGAAVGLLAEPRLASDIWSTAHWQINLLSLAQPGALGLAIAIVIRLIAVRTAPQSLPAVFD